MRSPCGVGEADRECRTERAEVAGHVLVGAGRIAQHEGRGALDEHHDRDPGEGGPQPVDPTRPSGSRAGNHPRDEVGNGFGRSDPDIPVDRGESLGEGSTLGAGGEMLVGDSGLVGVRFAVESGREHVADVVAIHVGKVGGGGDLVPIVRHCNLSWIT